MNTKLRQLEIGIMDIKAQSDRKVQNLADEFPSKLQREMRNIE